MTPIDLQVCEAGVVAANVDIPDDPWRHPLNIMARLDQAVVSVLTRLLAITSTLSVKLETLCLTLSIFME